MKSIDKYPEPCVCAGTVAQLRQRLAIRRMQLRNPNHGHVRAYPVWRPGMTTAEYIEIFEAKNSLRIRRGPGFTHRRFEPAPWNKEAEA